MWLKHVKRIINHPAIPPKVATTHTAASRSAKGDRQAGAITVPWGDGDLSVEQLRLSMV